MSNTESTKTETTTSEVPYVSTRRPGIDREKFMTILRKTKANVSPRKAWTRIDGNTGFRMYIQNSKTVRQVDLTGFGKGLPGTIPLRKKNGKVQAHLDLSNEKQALETFTKFLKLITTLKNEEVKEVVQKAA